MSGDRLLSQIGTFFIWINTIHRSIQNHIKVDNAAYLRWGVWGVLIPSLYATRPLPLNLGPNQYKSGDPSDPQQQGGDSSTTPLRDPQKTPLDGGTPRGDVVTVMIPLYKRKYPISFKLQFGCTNNMERY